MAIVNELSCECMKSELDLFAVPPTQTSIQQAEWVEDQPLTSILGGAPTEFDVIGSGEDYLDLTKVMLYVRAKVTQANGNNLAEYSTSAPVNLLLHSMFRRRRRRRRRRKCDDLKCVRKPTKSRLSLTHHANKSSR